MVLRICAGKVDVLSYGLLFEEAPRLLGGDADRSWDGTKQRRENRRIHFLSSAGKSGRLITAGAQVQVLQEVPGRSGQVGAWLRNPHRLKGRDLQSGWQTRKTAAHGVLTETGRCRIANPRPRETARRFDPFTRRQKQRALRGLRTGDESSRSSGRMRKAVSYFMRAVTPDGSGTGLENRGRLESRGARHLRGAPF